MKKRKIDDLYKELGVKKTATKAELKKAYRDRSKKTHPDKGGNPADFLAVKDAYEILTDDVKKLRYEHGDDPEQSIDSEVAGILAAALDAHILEIAEGKPVIGKIRKNIEKEISHILEAIYQKKREINTINKAKGKIVTKNKQENIFERVLESRLGEYEANIRLLQQKKEIFEKVLDILKDYEDMNIEVGNKAFESFFTGSLSSRHSGMYTVV